MKKQIFIIIILLLLGVNISYAQDVPISRVDADFLDNTLQNVGNDYQSGMGRVNNSYNRLMNMRLYNRENIRALAVYLDGNKLSFVANSVEHGELIEKEYKNIMNQLKES